MLHFSREEKTFTATLFSVGHMLSYKSFRKIISQQKTSQDSSQSTNEAYLECNPQYLCTSKTWQYQVSVDSQTRESLYDHWLLIVRTSKLFIQAWEKRALKYFDREIQPLLFLTVSPSVFSEAPLDLGKSIKLCFRRESYTVHLCSNKDAYCSGPGLDGHACLFSNDVWIKSLRHIRIDV